MVKIRKIFLLSIVVISILCLVVVSVFSIDNAEITNCLNSNEIFLDSSYGGEIYGPRHEDYNGQTYNYYKIFVSAHHNLTVTVRETYRDEGGYLSLVGVYNKCNGSVLTSSPKTKYLTAEFSFITNYTGYYYIKVIATGPPHPDFQDWELDYRITVSAQYTPPQPSCHDGIRNQDEIGIDCGGSCPNKDCCTNSYQDTNLGEGGIDCGGSCKPCVSCNNRIQDGDEEGVDCGGSCPETCHQLKILALSLRWKNSQQDFENAVNTQIDFFINSTELNDCRTKVKVDKLDVKKYNFRNFSCSSRDCGVDKIKPYIESLGISVKDYDHIIAFVESSPCYPIAGCSNGKDVAWVTTPYDIVAAHEIGHFYGLEDEYCSNQAGSNDPRCNDGGQWWWMGPIPIPPMDKNYLGADLGCNASIGDCCSDCSSNGNFFGRGDYFVCCEGNINPKGGRDIMSYANADGPRAFDNRSISHLNSFSKLQCTALKSFGIQSIVENKIIDLDLLIYNNGSVEKRWINLVDGKSSVITTDQGSHNLLLKDINNNSLFNYSFEVFFDYSGPMTKEENYSDINFSSYDLSMKIGYDTDMYKIEIWHNKNLVFSEIINFCNYDGICNNFETYLSCWQDCNAWSKDGLCINNLDLHCDSDCAKGIDPDCERTYTINLVSGWNLISFPLDLTNNSLAYLLNNTNYTKIFSYDGKYKELTKNETIDERYGLWINVLNDSILEMSGKSFINITYNLSNGWNLVGYQSLEEKNISEIFDNLNITMVYSYNGTWLSYNPNRPFNSLQTLKPGYGYWVKTE